MPNLCYYQMKLKGTKDNRDAFIRELQDYEEQNHFWRIFQVIVDEETEDSIIIEGDCAWSLESCCRASGYSAGVDLFEVNTRDLQLELEAYSSEPGIGFEEHYIYKSGECISSECVDMTEYWFTEFSSFAEFKEEYSLQDELTQNDLIDGEYYKSGGFGNWIWSI